MGPMQRLLPALLALPCVIFVGCSAGDPIGGTPAPVDQDAGQVEDDATPAEDAPAAALCHTGGYSCTDGVPCCGDQKCESGTCKPTSGTQCLGFGGNCAKSGCCQGYTCTKYAVGSRCAIAATCTKEGAACADSGNCCGGLTCRGGVCAPPLRQTGCKVIGETCGSTQTCCPSTPYCQSMACCLPSDWSNLSCGKNSDCCSGLCKGGLCLISDLGGPCTFDADCGQTYNSPITAPQCGSQKTCCVPKDGTCSAPSDCCSGTCVSGLCGCLPKGASTPDSGSCCSKVAINKVCG